MQKYQLRSCIVKIEGTTITKRNAIGERETEVIGEVRTHKGYFHTWAVEAYMTNGYLVGTAPGQVSTLYGLVEYEDGTMHKVIPEHIIFTDRGCHGD